MPSYQLTPFKQMPALTMAGKPEYVFGSFNDKTGPTIGQVISNSSVTTTATLTFRVTSGNVPVAGSLITVVGTANSSGVFNVTNASIASVTSTDNNLSGVITVTYTIASTSQGTVADAGQVQIPQPEVGEVMVNGASVPVAVGYNTPTLQARTVNATVSFPTTPTGGFVFLQGALFDKDSEYETLGLVSNINGSPQIGPTLEVADSAYRFYRLNVTGLTGAGKIVGKITVL